MLLKQLIDFAFYFIDNTLVSPIYYQPIAKAIRINCLDPLF